MSTAPDDHTIAEATREFMAGLGHATLQDIGPSLTCSEAEAFVQFLRAVGEDSLANSLLEAHAEDDEVGEQHYEGDAG